MRTLEWGLCLWVGLGVLGCSRSMTKPAEGHPSFEDDVAFLQGHGPLLLLTDGARGRIAVSPKWQGRIMTSAVASGGSSLGWINRPFMEAGRTGTQFDNWGGEDRFWLGPEAGPYALYFAPNAPFTFAAWQTPTALNQGEWTVQEKGDRHVVLARTLHVENRAGAAFDVGVERTVTLLSDADTAARLGAGVPPGAAAVAFETTNRITNAGRVAWTKEHGLPSVWILGMYAPSADATVVIPFDPKGLGPVVNDRYFGKVPADRLVVHSSEGFLTFKCDGTYRSKIGLGSARAGRVLGSYSASARLLTVVQYDKPAGAAEYVNSLWEDQKDPYAGDVVNAYNDGPTEPGKPSLGGFYEMETSSPAAALAPGESLVHVHRTFHVVGEREALDAMSRRVLGVGLTDLSK